MTKNLKLSEKRLAALEAEHGKEVINAISAVLLAIEEEKAEREKLNKDVDDILSKSAAQ